MTFTTVWAPFYSADGSALLILPLVNGFYDRLRAVLLSRWQRIARSSARKRLSWFARRFAQRMAAHCSFFRSSTAFTTVYAPYSSADRGGLLIHTLVNGFRDGLRAVLLTTLQWIAHFPARQQLSQFARRFALRMAAYCAFIHLSTAFPSVCAPYFSEDGSGLLILPLVNGFHGLRAVLLRGWQRIAHSSALQRLSRFVRRFAPRMAADCSFYCSSMAFPTVCVPYCSVDGIGLLTPPLANGFHDGLRAALLSGWHQIAHASARQRLSRRYCQNKGRPEMTDRRRRPEMTDQRQHVRR